MRVGRCVVLGLLMGLEPPKLHTNDIFLFKSRQKLIDRILALTEPSPGKRLDLEHRTLRGLLGEGFPAGTLTRLVGALLVEGTHFLRHAAVLSLSWRRCLDGLAIRIAHAQEHLLKQLISSL